MKNTKRIHIVPGLLLAALLVAAATNAMADTFYVTTEGDDSGGDGSQGNPWATIQHAINSVSNNGDTVLVGEGTYTENVVIAGKSQLTIKGGHNTNDWSWDPSGHASAIAAAAAGSDVVDFNTSQNTLIGLTLTGGRYGVYCRYGGGQAQTLTHCVISNNASSGIRVEQSGSKTALIARNCLVADNGGDGVYINVDNASVNTYIDNCTIVDNAGNGYYDRHQYTRTPYIRNCIIAGNAQYGITRDDVSQARRSYSLLLQNTCLYGNGLGAIYAPDESFTSTMRMVDAGGNLTGTPGFTGGGDYHLLNGSTCVDRGTDLSAVLTDDLDGAARTGTYDIGCYESAHTLAALSANTYADAASGDDANNGTTPATAKKTIGAALAITSIPGTTHVNTGLYAEVLFPPPAVTIEGAGWDSALVSNRTWYGVSITETNNTFRHLAFIGCDRGVEIVGENNVAEEATFAWCLFRDNMFGLVVNSAGTELDNCMVRSNTVYGIGGRSMPGNPNLPALILRNTLVTDNTSGGIYANSWDGGGGNNVYFYNSTIANNGGDGVYLRMYNNNTYIKNTIIAQNAAYGIHQSSWGGSDFYLDHSCNYGNGSGTHFLEGSNPGTYNEGAGMVPGDPQFVGAADYHLVGGSPCIDSGDDLSANGVTNDLDGLARTVDYDMGVYETNNPPVIYYPDTYVDASRPDNSGGGTNSATAKQNIWAALAITTNGGTCHVAAGTYNEGVSMPDDLTLEGEDRDTTIIIAAGSVATFAGTNATVKNVTLQGGDRGVYVIADDATVQNCIIQGNVSYGVHAENQLGLTVRDCTIRTNGIGIYTSSSPGIDMRTSIQRCIITDNTGHGVSVNGRSLAFLENVVSARNSGHGLYFATDRGTVPVVAITIYHCTLADNGGSGYFDTYSYNMPVYIRNSVLAGNSGYGIRRDRNAAYTQDLLHGYSCVSDNALGDISAASGDGRIVNEGGLVSAPPLFESDRYMLSSTSPCRDAGTDLGITVDIEGTQRPIAGGFDIGAYEAPPTGTVVTLR